jgi:cytochrome c-type biogenesis protein CcmF
MLSEMGFFFLIMAMGFTSVQVLASFWGVTKENKRFLTLGQVTAYLQGGCVLAAFVTLIVAFLICDFSISTVAFHDHTQLPWYYRFAATWGNHEGSLLLFVLILSGVGVALTLFLPSSLPFIKGRTLTIQGLLIFSFLIFLMITSNPFTLLPFSLSEGSSLNPLLQDQGLLIHPPILYLGYVGFSAPFSLAVAALWGEEDVKTWDFLVRPWALLAWATLTAGITLGSWWAYYELGWGGWWFWDPVENASFMPWLAATALLHTLRTERLYRWSLFLSLMTFELSLLGTFLVRSGLISSVHSFAQDTSRSLFILCLFGATFLISLGVWAWKARRLQILPLDFLSHQGALLLNSLLLFAGLLIVLLGTLYPLGIDWILGSKVAVGAPYFERTFVPLMIPLLILIPFGAFLKEKKEPLFPLLLAPLTVMLGTLAMLLYLFSPPSLWVIVGGSVGVWILGGTVVAFIKKKLLLGPTLAHMGVGVALLGVSMAGGLRTDESHILGLKESLEIGGITLTLEDVQLGKESTYLYEKATLSSPKGILTPEKRVYQPQNSLLTETAILTNGMRDIYVILGPYQGDSRWLIKASSLPCAPWIWIGGALMTLGAFISFFRRKLAFVLFLCLLPTLSLAETSLENRAQDLYKEVRCPVCAGQSIAESENPESIALRGFILDQLKSGKSEEALRDDLRILFGDDILFRPPLAYNTLLLWGAPFVLFLLIFLVFLWKMYRRKISS